MKKPTPKITAVAAAGAASTLVWTLLAGLLPESFTANMIATLTASTTTIFAFVLGYWKVG